MTVEIILNDENRLEMYIIPSSDTETTMLRMYGELFGFNKRENENAWRFPAPNGVVSSFKDAK